MVFEEKHQFQGMSRDLHPINQKNEMLWDAHNVRLTARENDTLLSITNEKGTLNTNLKVVGNCLGSCVLGKYLVLFTLEEYKQTMLDNSEVSIKCAHIYRINKNENGNFIIIELFRSGKYYQNGEILGSEDTLHLDIKHPLQTIGVYENDLVQKVYWTDGINKPRMINITKPELKIPVKDRERLITDGICFSPISNTRYKEELEFMFPNGLYHYTSFDFVRDVTIPDVEVEKIYGQGQFTPGTIQYAFTYYNKYEQESHIVYITKLYYISHENRGEDKDNTVSNSFKITLSNLDNTFEYVRVYAIHRSSLDAQPNVRLLTDLRNNEYEITCYDTGTTGSIIEENTLRYVGGEQFTAECMEQKDNALFLGNLTLLKDENWLDIKKAIVEGEKNTETWSKVNIEGNSKFLEDPSKSSYYSYTPTIDCTGFKTNETYRCGVQFQYKDGSWSDPVWHKDWDMILNTTYPRVKDNVVVWNTKALSFSSRITDKLVEAGYVAARPCVVFPSVLERDIIAQGMLCPTVYEISRRATSSPYAMSSWFLRSPYKTDEGAQELINDRYKGSRIEFRHNHKLKYGADTGAEIQGPEYGSVEIVNNTVNSSPDELSGCFFIDENIVTFHSPDVEFNDNFANFNLEKTFTLAIIGKVELSSIIGDINIATSTPAASKLGSGFVHKQFGYSIGISADIMNNNGITAGLFYNDTLIDKDGKPFEDEKDYYHMIYPWHRSGSVNNSPSPKEGGTRTAMLDKKKISNLKYFDKFTKFDNEFMYNVRNPQFFNSDQMSISKVWVNHLQKSVPYYGNVQTVINFGEEYTLYGGSNKDEGVLGNIIPVNNIESLNTKDTNSTSKEMVGMNYKSTPHLVFSLMGDKNTIPLLPVDNSVYDKKEESGYDMTDWEQEGVSKKTEETQYRTLRVISKNPYMQVKEGKTPGGSSYRQVWGPYYENKSYVEDYIPKANREGYTFIKFEDLGNGKIHGFFGTFDSAGRQTFYHGEDILREIREGDIFKLNRGQYESYIVEGNGLVEPTNGNFSIRDEYFKVVKYNFLEAFHLDSIGGSLLQDEVPVLIGGTLQRIDYTELPNEDTRGDEESGEDDNKNMHFNYDRKTFGGSVADKMRPYMLIAELRRNASEESINKFGGKTEEALKANKWVPAGEVVKLQKNNRFTVSFTQGDTWYSRYDCLKTYAFTPEDPNQIIEIGSFMCESRINIDGRTDRNRGQLSNIDMSPINFNLMNDVYSQKDNFFEYMIFDDDFYKNQKFANQVIFSLDKHAGEDTDTWTGITMAAPLDMDGTKGEITALKTFKDKIFCFQEKQFSWINYNNRVQIPTSDGVPVELTNSYKVDGYQVISNNIGCQDKWAIITTPIGMYFIDYITHSIYAYTGEGTPTDLSTSKGFRFWIRDNATQQKWVPTAAENNGIRLFYDSINQDIYFVPGIRSAVEIPREALCYSEQLQQFTSFMSYGRAVEMFNYEQDFYSVENNFINNQHINKTMKLWKNFAGEYNNIFDNVYPFKFSFISNDIEHDSHFMTKVFDTVEVTSDIYDSEGKLLNICPFTDIYAENEYQKSNIQDLSKDAKKKFRVWRMNVPRSSKVAFNKSDIERASYGRSRIRNPWTKIELSNNNPGTNRFELHDLKVRYSI